MIGCRKKITLITGQQMDLDIRPGVETGTEFASQGKGFVNPHTGRAGRFVIVISIKVPAVTNPGLVSKLRNLNKDLTGSNWLTPFRMLLLKIINFLEEKNNGWT